MAAGRGAEDLVLTRNPPRVFVEEEDMSKLTERLGLLMVPGISSVITVKDQPAPAGRPNLGWSDEGEPIKAVGIVRVGCASGLVPGLPSVGRLQHIGMGAGVAADRPTDIPS